MAAIPLQRDVHYPESDGLFDPLGDYLKPPLQGFRLIEGRYRPIPAESDGSLRSLVTGLIFRPEADSRLRMVDVETGELVLSDSEIADRLEAAEAELARLRREG